MDNLYKYSTEKGEVVPQTSQVLGEVQDEWTRLFGTQLSLDASTIQGRIIELQTALRKAVIANMALMANQLNPQLARGAYLDAIASYFGLSRKSAQNSFVNATLGGIPPTTASGSFEIADNSAIVSGDSLSIGEAVYTFGSGGVSIGSSANATASNLANAINSNANSTVSASASGAAVKLTAKEAQVYGDTDSLSLSLENSGSITASGNMLSGGVVNIPSGSTAQDKNGNIWVLNSDVQIPPSGSISAVFTCQESGAVVLNVGELNIISSAVAGWETITNNSVATIGYETESDASFRKNYQNEVAINASSTVAAMYAALYQVDGMQSVYILENYMSSPQTSADNPLIPQGETVGGHSLMVIVNGQNASGDFDYQTAQAIMTKKTAGCGLSAVANKSNVKTVEVSDGDYDTLNTVVFNYAAKVPVFIKVVVQNINYGGEVKTAVQNLLLDWFAGNLDTEEKVAIGKSISPFEISSLIMGQIGVRVKNCLIGTSAGNLSVNEIEIATTQIATIEAQNITVELES